MKVVDPRQGHRCRSGAMTGGCRPADHGRPAQARIRGRCHSNHQPQLHWVNSGVEQSIKVAKLRNFHACAADPAAATLWSGDGWLMTNRRCENHWTAKMPTQICERDPKQLEVLPRRCGWSVLFLARHGTRSRGGGHVLTTPKAPAGSCFARRPTRTTKWSEFEVLLGSLWLSAELRRSRTERRFRCMRVWARREGGSDVSNGPLRALSLIHR
jgi:hypothetical protein